MIQSKKDYYYYLTTDRERLQIKDYSIFEQIRTEMWYIWQFEKLLRKCEYYKNVKKGRINHVIGNIFRTLFQVYSLYLNISIPLNAIGPGLSIAHGGPIVISPKAHLGKNLRIHNCTSIGVYNGKAPQIGNNVWIGPGVRIFGEVEIADGIAIGANAVVNKSFTEPDITIAGIPAHKVSNIGSRKNPLN